MTFTRAGISVRSALIATYSGQTLDTFYVTEFGGRSLPPARREFILKDVRVFFRDPTQWSQLILLGVLLVVYIFNIKSLPLFSGERVSFFLVSLVVWLRRDQYRPAH